MEASDERKPDDIVYELWSDEDLRWIEIPCPTVELATFLELWCEKNSSIFRRRPFTRTWQGRTLVHPRHGRIDINTAGR